jgi:hypothetical protein
MDTYDSIFKIIEEYKTMTIEALQYSKIGKGQCGGGSRICRDHKTATNANFGLSVMRKIATLDGIPRNEDLKITQRASKLMNEVRASAFPVRCSRLTTTVDHIHLEQRRQG